MSHAGGKIDDRLLNQVAGATPRRLKGNLAKGADIRFEPSEVRLLASSMVGFVRDATIKVDEAVSAG
jgi:hypothetical protein